MTTRVRNIGTSQMTATELARVWAEHHDVRHITGGWLYATDSTGDPMGTPVAQGWTALADLLTRLGAIKVGVGVNWALQITPRRVAALRRVETAERADRAAGRRR